MTPAERAREIAWHDGHLAGCVTCKAVVALVAAALEAEAAQTRALETVVRKGLNAPSGEPICACRNRNAVTAGMEAPCWYCELRAALTGAPREEP